MARKEGTIAQKKAIKRQPRNWSEIGDYYPKERAKAANEAPDLELPSLGELGQVAKWLNEHRETKELQELIDAWRRFKEQFDSPQKELDHALAVMCDDPFPHSSLTKGGVVPHPCDATLRTLMRASHYQLDHLIEFHVCPACGKDFASAPHKGQGQTYCDDHCRDRFRRGWRNGEPNERAVKAYKNRLASNKEYKRR